MNEHFSMLYSNMRKRHATPSGALPTRPSKATGLASLMLCGVADAYATLIVAHRGPEFFTDIGRNSDIWSNYSHIYIYISGWWFQHVSTSLKNMKVSWGY